MIVLVIKLDQSIALILNLNKCPMKKAAKALQPEKVEPNFEQLLFQVSSKKGPLHHKSFDHNHGRVNKNPFGINHEPGIYP